MGAHAAPQTRGMIRQQSADAAQLAQQSRAQAISGVGSAIYGAQTLIRGAANLLHAGAAAQLGMLLSSEALGIATVAANLDYISTSRGQRATVQAADANPAIGSDSSAASSRLHAAGYGAEVVVNGMVAGDQARAIAMFQRYGYMVNRAMVPPRLDVMDHYSYWQLDEPTILGRIPADERTTIAAAFGRGVTVWTAVADIGTHPGNAPRGGISY